MAVFISSPIGTSAWQYNAVLDRTVFAPDIGFNWPTLLLAVSLFLLLWATTGGLLGWLIGPLFSRRRADRKPRHTRDGQVHRLKRPDGVELQVESYGPADAPPIILIHGWGTNSTEWYYLKRQLSDRFRLIVWDLPGVGRSTRSDTGDYSVDAFAATLRQCCALQARPPFCSAIALAA